jgi:hypothetical protein
MHKKLLPVDPTFEVITTRSSAAELSGISAKRQNATCRTPSFHRCLRQYGPPTIIVAIPLIMAFANDSSMARTSFMEFHAAQFQSDA